MHTDGVTVISQWPLQHFFDCIFSFDSIVSNLQYPRDCQGELWIIVRGGRSLVSRRIKMLRQVNERRFLYFEVPRWNGTSRSDLCNAQKLADDVRAYFADEELW